MSNERASTTMFADALRNARRSRYSAEHAPAPAVTVTPDQVFRPAENGEPGGSPDVEAVEAAIAARRSTRTH